jgi:hypothetical protein
MIDEQLSGKDLIGHGCDPVKILSIEKSVRVTNILAKV